MKVLFIITTQDGETIFNAMRLANVGVKKGAEISVFMLGKGVLFEQAGMKSHGLEGSSSCPIGWMDDLYELAMDADKVLTF